MKMNMKVKNQDISDAVISHFDKKLQRLEKFLGREVEADVFCSKEKDRHRVELTIHVGGSSLRSEDYAGDLYSALDLASERMERQIEKYKTRMEQRKRDRESIRKATPERLPEFTIPINPDSDEIDDDLPQIVRSKQFALKPIDPEEACLQMDLLGHSFYVFLNAETDLVSVVYKRKDGNYGLIEPSV